ncbi:MAG: hypothetical protein IKK18_02930 [Clostridia bacterium]|nr:hypothetical protein [Clostridia bacterium]
MVENDTIELLRECNAGVKMGISAIDEVLDSVDDENFKKLLIDSKKEHEKLGEETRTLLNDYHDSGKSPNPMAKGMSWMKTNVMLAVEPGDDTVADLITDGCNMGVKSLHKYLNKYKAAEEKAKDITKRLINIEERLAIDIRIYL